MVILDFLNESYTFVTGLLITLAAVVGVFYKGLTWLRSEVTKENHRIKEEVKSENEKIKEHTLERIEAHKLYLEKGADVIAKELKHNNEIATNKLDTIQHAANQNRQQIEIYQRDIGKTVTRNNEKVNEHETRLTVLETRLASSKHQNERKRVYDYDEDENGNGDNK